MFKILFLMLISFSTHLYANDTKDINLSEIQHQWAIANYDKTGNEQLRALESLIEKSHQFSTQSNQSAESLIWEGIVSASYAKALGGIGALKYAEKSKNLLLEAEKKDPEALQGSVYCSLGSLYYKVPGWPIGFGDKKLAKNYLEKALQINPNGIDPNYFYADFLADQGNYTKAIEYYKHALAAPTRLGREDADAGRMKEVQVGLRTAELKIGK